MNMQMKNYYKILFRKIEGKRPFVRPSHRWKKNTEMGFGKIESEDTYWIYLAKGRVQ
jgi:hypothetical protein